MVTIMEASTSLAIIALIMVINSLFFIYVLVKSIRILTEAQKFLEVARMHIAPIAHDAAQVMSEVRRIVNAAEKDMEKVSDSVEALKETAYNVRNFEIRIEERLERPIREIALTLAAIAKGGRTFWRVLFK